MLCSWATWSVFSPQGFLAGTPGRSLSGIRSDNTTIWLMPVMPEWVEQVCVFNTLCVLFLPGGSVHANCGGGHRRPLRTVVSLLWCWHTHVVPGRQGENCPCLCHDKDLWTVTFNLTFLHILQYYYKTEKLVAIHSWFHFYEWCWTQTIGTEER